MFANSTEILSQINAIIKENPSIEKSLDLELSMIEDVLQNANSAGQKNSLFLLKKPQLKKLEKRIEKLERYNDQLLCFINFLFIKISDLTSRVIIPEQNHIEKTDYEAGKADVNVHHNNNYEKPETDDCKCRPELTKREMDVFGLLEKGLCAKEIAKILFISETTVITHKRNLKEKFNARNTNELISKVLAK